MHSVHDRETKTKIKYSLSTNGNMQPPNNERFDRYNTYMGFYAVLRSARDVRAAYMVLAPIRLNFNGPRTSLLLVWRTFLHIERLKCPHIDTASHNLPGVYPSSTYGVLQGVILCTHFVHGDPIVVLGNHGTSKSLV